MRVFSFQNRLITGDRKHSLCSNKDIILAFEIVHYFLGNHYTPLKKDAVNVLNSNCFSHKFVSLTSLGIILRIWY